jgi:two-component system OmpR family response regulator
MISHHKIMVVEDDPTLLGVLKYNLSKEGYTVLTASDGATALELARRGKPDLALLDIMLPGLSGLEVCRILRQEMTLPIILLTAKIEESDKIVGLELGADDYITKPFSLKELLARVHAALRRGDMTPVATEPRLEGPIQIGDLTIDLKRHQVTRNRQPLDMSPKEYALLAFLVQNRGQVFSRDFLLEKIWGYDFGGGTRTVDVHMRWLRQKIETVPGEPRYLLTVRGSGYRFEG